MLFTVLSLWQCYCIDVIWKILYLALLSSFSLLFLNQLRLFHQIQDKKNKVAISLQTNNVVSLVPMTFLQGLTGFEVSLFHQMPFGF